MVLEDKVDSNGLNDENANNVLRVPVSFIITDVNDNPPMFINVSWGLFVFWNGNFFVWDRGRMMRTWTKMWKKAARYSNMFASWIQTRYFLFLVETKI